MQWWWYSHMEKAPSFQFCKTTFRGLCWTLYLIQSDCWTIPSPEEIYIWTFWIFGSCRNKNIAEIQTSKSTETTGENFICFASFILKSWILLCQEGDVSVTPQSAWVYSSSNMFIPSEYLGEKTYLPIQLSQTVKCPKSHFSNNGKLETPVMWSCEVISWR